MMQKFIGRNPALAGDGFRSWTIDEKTAHFVVAILPQSEMGLEERLGVSVTPVDLSRNPALVGDGFRRAAKLAEEIGISVAILPQSEMGLEGGQVIYVDNSVVMSQSCLSRRWVQKTRQVLEKSKKMGRNPALAGDGFRSLWNT